MTRSATFVSVWVLAWLTAPVFAQDSREEVQEQANAVYTGPPIIERTLSGKHVCMGLEDGKPCGEDTWTMTLHSDGTRMIRSHLNQSNYGTQIDLVMHADAKTFRPIHAYASVYSGGGWLGAGQYAVEDDTLRVAVTTPLEQFVETVDLPENFTLLLHPISADGWHYGAGYDKAKGGVQMHNLCTLGAAGRSVHCAVYPIALEFLGMEELTVPAGTFNTEHYRFGENTDVWITGPDRVMIQHEYRVRGSRYQLVELDGEL